MCTVSLMETKKIKRTSFYELLRYFEKSLGYKNDINWTLFIVITIYHIFGVYWSFLYAFPVKWQTVVFAAIMFFASGFGITAGAHRYWTHKAYKAKLPLKIFLMICYASAGQNSIKQWVRDHRTHHKFSDTDADPHNANRGLFFSHIGWLMMKKKPQVLEAGKKIDMSDIDNDLHLQIFEKYFNYIKLLFCYILPITLVVWMWGEHWRCAIAWHFVKFLVLLHCELTANSLAHAYGYRPYNKSIIATENRFVATCTFGEGWHNYHHAFPFDYKAAEHFDFFNWGTRFIQLFEKIGWAYDLKQATPAMINKMAKRLGDGTPIHFPTRENVEHYS